MKHILLFTLIFAFLGCGKNVKSGSKTNTKQKSKINNSDTNKKPVAETVFPPASYSCIENSDCGYHLMYLTKDGKCCKSCNYEIGSVSWIKQVEKICSSKDRSGCIMAKCKTPPEVVCYKKKCQKRLNYKKRMVGAYKCEKDSDCIKTCPAGAINKEWYKNNKKFILKCRDGCASPRLGRPKCVDKSCVAFDRKGKRMNGCTNKKVRFLN